MNKRTNVSFGIIAMLLIGLSIYTINYPREAYAQTFQVLTGFQYPIVAMEYQSTSDLFWVLTQNTTNQKSFLYWIDRPNKAIIGSSNLTQMIFSFVGETERVHDIGCGKTDCFVTTGDGGTTGYIFKIPSFDINPNIFRGKNITASISNPVVNAPFWHILVEDNVVSGFGAIRLYVGTCSENEATCDYMVRVINGVSMTDTGIFTIFDVTNIAGKREHGMRLLGNSAVSGAKFAMIGGLANVDSSSSATLFVYDSDMVGGCTVQPTPPIQTTPLSLDVRFVDYGSANNRIYVGGVDGNVYVYNQSCALIQSLTTNDTGLAGDIRFIDYDSGKLFMQESGGSAKIAQLLIDATGNIITAGEPSIYFPQPTVAQTSYDSVFVNRNVGDQMTLLAGNGQVWYIYTGIDKRVGILTLIGGATGTAQACIETVAGSGILDLCFTDTDGNGVPDNGQAGALGAYRSNSNLTSFATDVFCAFGINTKACTDKNIQTNGVGLVLLALLIIVLYAFLVSIHIYAQQKLRQENVQVMQALNIHPILLLVILVISVGIAKAFTWIDNTIFYTMVVLMIGVAGLGFYKITRGGGNE